MARLKSDEAAKRDTVRADFKRLYEDHEKAQSSRRFMTTVLQDPRMVKVLSLYERDIEEQKELLVTVEKKDMDRMQASVKARRELLATLRHAYETELQDSQKQLEDFKRNHALFLQAEDIDVETGEVKEA